MAPYATLSIALFKIRAQYGLRPFAKWSILAFVVASLLNLFVSDLHSALVVRFISGCAGAPISSLGFIYVLEAFPPEKKLTEGLCVALMGTLLAAPIARMVSPGLLDIDGWHALYTLELGLALVSMVLLYTLPVTPPPRAQVIARTDILSYLLMAAGLGCLAVFFILGRLSWWFATWWLGLVLHCGMVLLLLSALFVGGRRLPNIAF